MGHLSEIRAETKTANLNSTEIKPATFDRMLLENTNYAILAYVKFKSIRSHRILSSGSKFKSMVVVLVVLVVGVVLVVLFVLVVRVVESSLQDVSCPRNITTMAHAPI